MTATVEKALSCGAKSSSLLKIEKEKEVTPNFYYLVAIDSAIVTTIKKLLA